MNKELTEKLRILVDMENNNYLMNRCIRKLDGEIASLGIPKNIPEPQAKSCVLEDRAFGAFALGGSLIGAVIGGIIGVFLEEGFFGRIGGAITGVIYAAIPSAVAGLIIGLIYDALRKKRLIRENTECLARDVAEYAKAATRDKKRVETEIRQKSILTAQRKRLQAKLDESKMLLNKFCAATGIDPVYRNIIPLNYMYEFARLGISDSLEGVNGINHLVRNELRADQFKYSLDEISRRLDAVIDHQHAIYDNLCSMNQKCNRLLELENKSAVIAAKNNALLEKTVENTEMMKYIGERIEAETAFSALMLVCNQ